MDERTNGSNQWVKCAESPVLGGALGTCFDVSVIRPEGKYRMYFSWRPKKSIALTESADGIHWSEPVVVLSPVDTPQGWEDDLNRPCVLFHGGRYEMWYTGQYKPGEADGKSWIFHAESQDGVRWTRTGSEPLLCAEAPWEKTAVMNPNVLWDEAAQLYKMWYSAGEQYEPNAIGYAESSDGLAWCKHSANPVFMADKSKIWERHKVAGCQVFQREGWYYSFYIGYRDEHFAQIGLARSKDGITAWERCAQNPIIAPSEGAWDSEACYKPFAIFDGEKWLLWYNGRTGACEQIGLATKQGEDLGFE